MRNESPSHEIIVQYILGELSEAETQQIEEKYFAAPEFLNELECTSDELLADYLQNNLPHAQKIKLEQRCQQLPLLGTKLAIHRLFASYPKQTSLTVATSPQATSAFFSAHLKLSQRLPPRSAFSC